MIDERDWYKRAFNADYLDVYSHRDDASAKEEVDWALHQMTLPQGSTVLDLCCGNGRHSEQLARRGLKVIAGDLSLDLLSQARARENKSVSLVRLDMRHVPLADQSMDAAFSFFTSFGYFEADRDNKQVLIEIARTLKPEAPLCFDFLNEVCVRKNLVPESVTEKDGSRLTQRRSISADGLRVEKEITFETGRGPATKTWESVRLFSVDDLRSMFESAGLEVVEEFGSLAGHSFSPTTPRLVVIGKRRSS